MAENEENKCVMLTDFCVSFSAQVMFLSKRKAYLCGTNTKTILIMKKLLLLILLVTYCVMGYGQIKVAEYYSKGYDNTFDIDATESKNGTFDLYIYCHSFEEQPAGFIVKNKNLTDFCIALNAVKNKYEEWTKLAKENGVDDYSKAFDVKFKPVTAFFRYGDNWHQFYKDFLKPVFYTIGGQYLVVMNSGVIAASDNRYITVKGFSLAFASVEEIDNFIKLLNTEAILQKLKGKTATDELFK